MAPAMAPHAKQNDIATSLECREVLIDFVAYVGLGRRGASPDGAQPSAFTGA